MGGQSLSGSSGHKAETNPGQDTLPWQGALPHTDWGNTDTPVHLMPTPIFGMWEETEENPLIWGERARRTQTMSLAGIDFFPIKLATEGC